MLPLLPEGQLFVKNISVSKIRENATQRRASVCYTDPLSGKRCQRVLQKDEKLLYLQLKQKQALKKLIPIYESNLRVLISCLNKLRSHKEHDLFFTIEDLEKLICCASEPGLDQGRFANHSGEIRLYNSADPEKSRI